jgi:hypothetical protein
MHMNEYALEVAVRDRLAELRAQAERSNRVRAVRPASRPLRVALGHALIRMGNRLLGVRGERPVGSGREGPRGRPIASPSVQ